MSLSQTRPLDPSSLEARLPAGWWVASFGEPTRPGSEEPSANRRDFSSTAAAPGGRARALRVYGEPGGPLPATAEDASCVAIFDGLLYNRAELSDGRPPSSPPPTNDADLILRAYLRSGGQVLDKLKGTFALIIWDRTRDVLLCARDPVGIYPLFYAHAGRALLVSTSVEALVRQPGVSGEVNRPALAEYLCHAWVKPEETYYAAVRRLLPGHAMRANSAGLEAFRYWNPHGDDSAVEWVTEAELERFDGLFDQAVNRCLEQGPTGIFLSGGLDSVSVAAIAADNSRRRGLPVPRALSLAFPDPGNEEAVQRGVASQLGLPQDLIPMREAIGPSGLLWSAMELSARSPAPLLNVWSPAYHYLAESAKRRGRRAVLTGHGGDEWLLAHPIYAADLIRGLDVVNLYRLWDSMRRSYNLSPLMQVRNIAWTFGVRPHVAATLTCLLRAVGPGVLAAWRQHRWLRWLRRARLTWVAPDGTLRREMYRRREEQASEPAPDGFYLRTLRRALDSSVGALEMEELFESSRRMGLRLAHPFWDAELVDFLYRTPPHLLSRDGRSKGLVRQALARRFPNLGFERQRKVAATDFFRTVLRTEGPVAWRRLGGAQALARLGIVDAAALDRYMDQLFRGAHPAQAYRIWFFLTVEAWLQPRLERSA